MLTFRSSPGKTYKIVRSFDLENFTDIETGITSGGEITVAPSIPASEAKSFYEVIEE